MKHILTRQSARDANACYSNKRLADLIPEQGLTPLQLAALAIPAADRFWALNLACGATPRQQREQACRCARRRLERESASGREPDARSWEAVRVAGLFARGEATADELRTASTAAYAAASAAYTAAYATATYAAYAAASAAYDTATYAAVTAAYTAAYATATYAADADTERDTQVLEYAAALEAANNEEP